MLREGNVKETTSKMRFVGIVALTALMATTLLDRAYAQHYRERIVTSDPTTDNPLPQPTYTKDDGNLHLLPVQGHVYMLVGAGGNITISAGDEDGLLLVDSGNAQSADRVAAMVEPLSVKPIRYVINTSMDRDHTGGNGKISAAGETFTGGNVAGDLPGVGSKASVFAQENVLHRMAEDKSIPYGDAPSDTFIKTQNLSHFFNGEGVQMIHIPNAHTDGDTIVYFRFSDVIATGDLFTTTGYPVIDLDKGGNLQGVIDGLNRILQLAVPYFRTEGGTLIVPGHGRLCDSAEVGYYRDMLTIIRDRVQDLIKKGKTLEEVKNAHPTSDYDPRYGSTSGSWTTDMFVEAVYKSLKK
jgi:cyclase